MDAFPRPSHADFTYLEKYGVKAFSGGGRSSARETISRVAAGAVAEKVLREAYGVEIVAFTSSIGAEALFPERERGQSRGADPEFLALIDSINRPTVDAFQPVRCPSAEAAARMEALIARCRDAKDSVGGTVTCVVRGAPAGLGEPCFDKLEALLAHGMLSIPATKGFEIGSGFGGTSVRGSRHNDAFVRAAAAAAPGREGKGPRLTTRTNNSGGIQGGISNGTHIYLDVAFKPPATIGQAQSTAGYDLEDGVLEAKGRHDPCVVPRAIPIVEAMAALVILDAAMAQEARVRMRGLIPVADKSRVLGVREHDDVDGEEKERKLVNGS